MSIDQQRRKLLAAVHIAAKAAKVCEDCGAVVFPEYCPRCGSVSLREMCEIDYRRFLKEITGKTSCRELKNWELKKVMSRFYRYGYSPEDAPAGRSDISKQKMIHKIKTTAKEKLGKTWVKRLSGYIRKIFKKEEISELNLNELRSVWGFLRKVN